MITDPRNGDAEADHASPKARSLLAIAGSLLIEISPLKLIGAVIGLIVAPALALGLSPLAFSQLGATLVARFGAIDGIWPALVAAGLAAGLVWAGWRLFWLVETSFWSMNALLVQPLYALFREGLRQLTDSRGEDARANMRRRAAMALAAGILAALVAAGIAALAWPGTEWEGRQWDRLADFGNDLTGLIRPALLNAIFLTSVYAATASLIWGVADALMAQPEAADRFDRPGAHARPLRVAHLSDVHVVGERYGFRLESGRRGPRGNERFAMVLERLAAMHRDAPLDLLLFSGDMTDAGRAPEWAEFFDLLDARPELAARSLILPGNHDLNIIDGDNPARLEWPLGAPRRLRKIRLLSAMERIQGTRARLADPDSGALGPTLSEALAEHRDRLTRYADQPAMTDALVIDHLCRTAFPQVILPQEPGGVGVIVLDSNAETHFSFTNALGLMSTYQTRTMEAVLKRHPDVCFLVALHHHIVEYPARARVLSERIGTALINGSWFMRRLQTGGQRLAVLHGHRHVDWIGRCGDTILISAPSPVMDATDAEPTAFYIHRFWARDGRLHMGEPERIVLTPPGTSLPGTSLPGTVS